MIPAILSCVFVIYLYFTLNTEDSGQDSGDEQALNGLDIGAMTKRLANLEQRLERVIQADPRLKESRS